MALLLILSTSLAYALIRYGGVLSVDRDIVSLLLGATAAVYFLRTRRYDLAPQLDPWVRWPLVLLIAYSVFQLVPLPLAALRLMSPERAEIAAAAGGGWAPLTVSPGETLLQVTTIGACALTFLMIREAAWRLEKRWWMAMMPIVAIAVLEAALGLAQFYSNAPAGVAHGTYVNRNHFAGFLEMALPFSVALAVTTMRSPGPRRRTPLGPAIKASAALAAAALILAGIIYSFSRMGFAAALFGLGVAGTVFAVKRIRVGRAEGQRKWLLTAAGGGVAVLALLFMYLPPDQLIARFAQLAATDEITADTRMRIWRESGQVVAAYPVFGCGLGGYEAAFLKYKQVAPMQTVDYAHDDYLQGLAELGTPGFALCALLAGLILRRAVCGARRPLAAAAVGALAAMALHSFVDFNLYIPANLITVAWISGLTTIDPNY